LVGLADVSLRDRLPDPGRTYRYGIQQVYRDLLQLKALALAELLQQMIIPQPALAKPMIVTDDHRMRMKFFKQELLHILFCGHLRKRFGKRHDHQVVHFLPGQKPDLLLQGIKQLDGCRSAPDNLARMWKKSDDHRLPVDPRRFLSELLQDLRVTGMNAVKSAYRNDRPPESWQLFCMVMYLHVLPFRAANLTDLSCTFAPTMSLYAKRGVSAQKEEVHQATEGLDQGLYPNAFCKIYPDYLGGDADWVNLMHADGAGTKSILAYLYWKETGDLSVWKGIARDAIAMNLDDLLCVGIYDNLLFSSTIDRNKRNIPGDVLSMIINGSQEFFDELRTYGVGIKYLGGETADVGDVVRTIAVNGTMTARWPKDRLVTNDKIKAGDVIVGFSSSGQAAYEMEYNSGIGSNGLTSARHDTLQKTYGARFQESYDTGLDDDVVYIGPHLLTEPVNIPPILVSGRSSTDIGHLLLSPTRTYAPLLKLLLTEQFDRIHGLIHCSGGGQTKCMKYLPGNFRIIKDNLFEPPLVFKLIQQASGSDPREMYQVFNMGHRLEIFTDPTAAEDMIRVGRQFGIGAQIVGRVESAAKKSLSLIVEGQEIVF
jgi:phosphoribosylformylglycinamidine cyclo-ligase